MLKATKIKWDTDGDRIIFRSLPKELAIPMDLEEIYNTDPDEGEDLISDYLSDKTGYCHCGFELQTK